jgi:single-stranded-DNA-specific exonuclease
LDVKPNLDAEDIGFTLGPRLNAAGRLGQAQLAVELLTTTSPERAGALAEYLHELNSSRESLERSVNLASNKQAHEQFDPAGDAALVLAGRDWHAGVIGIVAGRLAEKYHRPVVIISLDPLGVKPGIGSVRGVAGFDVQEALAACSELLVSHGGHAAAAGLKIDESRIEMFREHFCRLADDCLSDGDRLPDLWIDAETPLSALTLQAIEQLEQLGPFGHGNLRPLLCSSGITLVEPPRKIGGGGRHLSLRLAQHGVQIRGVAFGMGERAEELERSTGQLSVAFRPVVNRFQGRCAVELHVVDWQATMVTPAAAAAVGGGVQSPGTGS